MAVKTNKTEWVDSFAKSIGESSGSVAGSDVNTNPGATTSNPDKYAALETTSYKDMLSSKIQASAAREQANKYVGTTLGANGLGTQGISESARVGIANQYGQAIANADQTHQANVLDIESQRQDDLELKNTESWQNAMTMLNQASSQEDLDYIKNNFYSGMSDEQKKMFDYYYSSYSSSMNSGDYNSLEMLNSATYENASGNVSTLGEHFGEETKVLWHHGSNNDYEKGDVIKVTNGEGDTIYMKWAGNGFITTNEAEYNNAASNNVNSFELTRGSNKTNNYKQVNKKQTA